MVSLHLDAPAVEYLGRRRWRQGFARPHAHRLSHRHVATIRQRTLTVGVREPMVKNFTFHRTVTTHAIRPSAVGTRVCNPRKLGQSRTTRSKRVLADRESGAQGVTRRKADLAQRRPAPPISGQRQDPRTKTTGRSRHAVHARHDLALASKTRGRQTRLQ